MRRPTAIGFALALLAFAPETTSQTPSAYSHAANLVCAPSYGLRASARGFVESFATAKTAWTNNEFAEALRHLEFAAAYANDDREWIAIEQIRIACFYQLGNVLELIASLEALLATENCLSEPETKNYLNLLEEARNRIGVLR